MGQRDSYVVPVLIEGKAEFVAKFPTVPRYDKEQLLEVTYCKLGRSTAFHQSRKTGSGKSIVHTLYRDGELISQYGNSVNGSVARSALLQSYVANPDVPKVNPCGVFIGIGHFPPVGYVAGYHLDDYLPPGQCELERRDGLLRVSGQTDFGIAEAWFDEERGNVLKRCVIEKTAGHRIDSSRTLGDVLYFKNDEDSRLERATFEVEVTEIGQSPAGQYFIEKCSLSSIESSAVSVVAEHNIAWRVERVSFDPVDVGDRFIPPISLNDGEAVLVKDANQIPYRWSEEEQWAVPNVADIDRVERRASTKFLIIVTGCFLMLGIVILLMRKRRG